MREIERILSRPILPMRQPFCRAPGCLLSAAECVPHHDATEALAEIPDSQNPRLLRTAHGGVMLIRECGNCDGSGRVEAMVRHKIYRDWFTSNVDCNECDYGIITRFWDSNGKEI